MKIQLGLLNLNGRPVTPDDFLRMSGPYRAYNCDVAGDLIEGPLLMAYRGDRITYEEDFESQPFKIGPLVMTWDGRLDNREEVAAHANIHQVKRMSDPEIVLRAYAITGDSIFDDLIGEFALAVWHKRFRRLQFARSACGARTLYYVLTKESLTWSSDFSHLVRVSDVDLKVNDEYVFDYFVCEPDSKQTALSNVKAAPPNRVLTFEDGRASGSRELWDPTRVKPLPHHTDEEYEQACREHIKNAVAVRLRSRMPVFAELSGGLDSSTIILTADQVLRERNLPLPSLQTLSCVYSQSETCDEQGFISAVTQERSIETHLISEQDQRITLGLNEDPPFTGLPNPLHCLPGRYEAFEKVMRKQKARVLLTGIGGDHLFISEPDGVPVVADLLWLGKLGTAHKECKLWSWSMSQPYYTTAKRTVTLLWQSIFRGQALYKEPEIPEWINSSNRKSFSPLVDFERYREWRVNPSQRARVFILDRLFRVLGAGFLNEYQQLYISHPFSHRPLIEFCLGSPATQFLRNGQTRSLMRRAMSTALPPKTANRVSKGLMDETILRAVRQEWRSIEDLSQWQVCQRGYVRAAELQKTLNRVRLGFLDVSGPLFRLFSLERWLRSLPQVPKTEFSKSPASGDARRFHLEFGVAAGLRA